MKRKLLLILGLLLYLNNGLAQQEKPRVKDDPQGRVVYEYNLLKSPITGKVPVDIRKKELAFVANSVKKNSLKATNWVHRGPFNVGGRTRALAIDVNNEDIILAAGVSGGVWRSTDGGASWVKTTGLSHLHSVTSIAQDPRSGHTDTWYYTTGELSGNSAGGSGAPYRGDGVFKSIDNGLTWSKLTATGDDVPQVFDRFFNYCWNVKINPVNGDVYVATYGRIYRSQDGGTNWDVVFSGGTTEYGEYSDIALTSTGICYATFSNNDENQGIFRSVDGTTWVDITPATFATSYNRIVLDIAASNENVLYFLAHTPGEGQNDHSLWKYTYISGDGTGAGGTWEDRSTNLPLTGGATGDFDSQGSYDLIVRVKPDDENFVVIGGVNLHRSTDGFGTTDNTAWIGGYVASDDSYAKYPNHHPDQHAFVYLPSDPKIVIMGSDGGLNKTDDITSTLSGNEPVVWSVLNTGYLTTQSYAIGIDNENFGDFKLMSGFQDNGTWITTNESGLVDWDEQGSGDGAYCDFGRYGTVRYSSSQYGRIYGDFYKLENGGYDYWTRVDPGTGSQFINPFILDPSNTNVMYYLGGGSIYRNSNLAEIPEFSSSPATMNWVELTNTAVAGSITALNISKEPANILVYGTNSGQLFKIENSITGDPIPVEITGGDFPDGNIGSVLINPSDASELFVTFSNYEVVSIWHSSDGGANWESISGNLEENADGTGNGPSVRWIEMLKMQGEDPIYFVGTSAGLYSTTTLSGNSTVWVQEGADVIGNVVVTMIKAREDGLVAVGTHANGLYSASYTPTNASNPEFLSASTGDVNKIILSFSKEMVSPAGRHHMFSVDDGAGNTVTSIRYKPADATAYELTLANPISVSATVTVSYSPGNIKSLDGGILQAFSTNVDNTVDVKKVGADIFSEVKIYPNPSNGQFKVELNSTDSKARTVIFTVYNMSGQLIYFSKEDNITNMIRDIDISNHPKGVYNLEIVEGGLAKNYKVMVK